MLPLLLLVLLLAYRCQYAQGITYMAANTFLRQHMPLSDTLDLSEDFISNNIQAALRVHSDSKFSHDIPDDIFLDYILPYCR